VASAEWDLPSARAAAQHALGHIQIELLRFGANGVFRHGEVVARVAPATLTPAPAAQASVALARWLVARGAAVTAPAGTAGDVVADDETTVTLWRFEQPRHGRIDAAEHARLVVELHAHLDAFEGALPRPAQLGEVERRLRLACAHPLLAPHASRLLARLDDEATRLSAAVPIVPHGAIHGDAHHGNCLRTSRGWILLDLDGVAPGLREWDYASAARSHDDTTEAMFGVDLEAWDGFAALSAVKRIDTLAWTAIHDRAVGGARRDEVALRLAEATG
jgi:Ser/Thr protein kinase RdoA (MazF antagonist)